MSIAGAQAGCQESLDSPKTRIYSKEWGQTYSVSAFSARRGGRAAGKLVSGGKDLGIRAKQKDAPQSKGFWGMFAGLSKRES